jgi:hypothetical protein
MIVALSLVASFSRTFSCFSVLINHFLGASVRSILDTFDNPQVALGPIPQNGECRLVLRTIVCSDCFGEALKLNHNGPLFDAVLIRLRGDTASEEAPARSEDSTLQCI